MEVAMLNSLRLYLFCLLSVFLLITEASAFNKYNTAPAPQVLPQAPAEAPTLLTPQPPTPETPETETPETETPGAAALTAPATSAPETPDYSYLNSIDIWFYWVPCGYMFSFPQKNNIAIL